MNETEIQAAMETALAGDASMHELLDAMRHDPTVQKCMRQAFRVGFGAGALFATRRATEIVKKGTVP